MPYKPPLKGIARKKEAPQQLGVGDLSMLISDLREIRDNTKGLVSQKLLEVDKSLDLFDKKSTDAINSIRDNLIESFDYDYLVKSVLSKVRTPKDGVDGKDGRDGKDANEQAVIKAVLAAIPNVNEAALEKRITNNVLSMIPNSGAKIVEVKSEQETTFEKLVSIANEVDEKGLPKLKLKTSNIDGLDQTISALRNQIVRGMGYVHGGGASTMAQLNDVVFNNLQDGNPLTYDSALGKWTNGYISMSNSITLLSTDAGGSGSQTLTNSTYRLLLNSFQKAEDPDNYGEVIRIYEDHDRAKQAIAWYDRFKSGSATFSSPTFTATSHYLENGERVVLSGTLPTNFATGSYIQDSNGDPVIEGTYYYVVNKTANTFQLSATKGGSAITGTGGSGITYTQLPQLKAWLLYHYNPNDTFDGTTPHDHISIETNDADMLIRTRFEVLTNPANTTEVNTANANFTVRSGINGVSGVDGDFKQFIIYTADGVIDQKQIYFDGTTAVGEANATTKRNKINQAITADTTRYTGVKLYKKADTGSFTGTVTVALYATSGGQPTGSALGSVTFSNLSWLALPVGEFTATFSSQINGLTEGNVYAVEISTSTASNTNYINLGTSTTSRYSGGVLSWNNSTDGWTTTTTDLYFKMIMPTSGVTRGKSPRWAMSGTDDIEQGQWDGTNWKLTKFDNDGSNSTRVLEIDRETSQFINDANSNTIAVSNSLSAGNTAANFFSESMTAASRAFQARVSGDSVSRFSIESSGLQEWGSGSATRDTNLYRASADLLKTDDTFQSKGGSYYLLKNSTLSVNSTTVANTLITSYSLPANTVEASGSSVTGEACLCIDFWFDINNTANSKVINIHMGTAGTTSDANIGTLTTTTTGAVGGRVNVKVWRQSATTIRAICTTYRGSTVSINQMTTTSTNVNFASNMTISVFGSSAVANDYTARAFEIELQR